MLPSSSRSWIAATAVAAAVLCSPARGLAQDSQKPAEQQPAQGGKQVAAGEEAAKPTRGFFSALFHNLGDDVKHIPRRNSVYWLAGGTALALAVHPEDDKINHHLIGSNFADNMFKPGKVIGSLPVILGAGVTTYLVGLGGDRYRAKHLGMDIIESAILSEGIVEGIKYSVRRKRPLLPDGTRYSGYAFPSGHATMTFAAATVLQQHLGWKAAVPTYAVASYVAISRMHDNRHFASDVAFGTATGIIIGRSVTWHGRNFYGRPLVVPGGGGVMLSFK
jgi:hypothetical protein